MGDIPRDITTYPGVTFGSMRFFSKRELESIKQSKKQNTQKHNKSKETKTPPKS